MVKSKSCTNGLAPFVQGISSLKISYSIFYWHKQTRKILLLRRTEANDTLSEMYREDIRRGRVLDMKEKSSDFFSILATVSMNKSLPGSMT